MTESSQHIVIHLGPSLSRHDARAVLDADYRPPVAQGDILDDVKNGATVIGIVDGYFENVPSVWHKEILFAMKRGIHVYGASSMGALRAAELDAFGMKGVGAIFRAYRDDLLQDDDEVAITHGPAELGYPILSEAMVNIRRTLSDALAAGIIIEADRRRLEALAKSLPYKQRTYARMFRDSEQAEVDPRAVAALRTWLPTGRADQKREDALEMLQKIANDCRDGLAPLQTLFHFERTLVFCRAARQHEIAA